MTQVPDYVVDDGSGVALLAQLNFMLPALNSGNSGTLPPPNPVAGMKWTDMSVSPMVVRLRNAANSAWIAGTPETVPARTVRGNAAGVASAITDLNVTQLQVMLGHLSALGGNGWAVQPGGLVLQWLSVGAAGSGNNGSVPFPVAFPTACVAVFCQYVNIGGDSAVGDNYVAQVRAVSAAGFTIRNLGPSAAAFYIFAVGF